MEAEVMQFFFVFIMRAIYTRSLNQLVSREFSKPTGVGRAALGKGCASPSKALPCKLQLENIVQGSQSLTALKVLRRATGGSSRASVAFLWSSGGAQWPIFADF